jgi:hypothetical protein
MGAGGCAVRLHVVFGGPAAGSGRVIGVFVYRHVAVKLNRLLKNTHLLRCAHHAALQRMKSTPHSSRYRAPCIRARPPQETGCEGWTFLNSLQTRTFSTPGYAAYGARRRRAPPKKH